jgi:hypothetical protein
MIVDKPEEYWVWLEGSIRLPNVYYCPDDEEEYLKHWGKWLVFAHSEAIRRLAEEIDKYIDSGEIDSAKFSRKPIKGKVDCVMCVYCDDRDKERVRFILHSFGVSRQIWKYDEQTYKDWEPGGRLYRQWKR